MNGDLGKIYSVISEVKIQLTEVSTKQEERHTENKDHLEKIDVALKHLESLPRVSYKDINRLYTWVWGIVIVVIGVAVRSIL